MPSELTEPNDATLDLKVPLSADDHLQGSEDAGVTLLEYGDYECPHCAAAAPIVKELQRRFGAELRYAWRHFPLPMHEMAEPAAEAAEWAGANGHFWEMHDQLLAHQEELSGGLLATLADEVGLDDHDLAEALRQHAFEESVAFDIESGEQSGVHGTPTFFINGARYEGAWEYAELSTAIEQELRRGGRRAA